MKRKIMNHVFTVIILAGLAVTAVLSYKLIQRQREYGKGQESLDKIYAVLETASVGTEADISIDREALERQQRLAGYEVLHAQNTDMVGWIRIDGTKVDYPVMQTPEEPEFYLHRSFGKERSSYGMIFMDADCRLDGSSPNLLLYGHHMKNGAMFAEIENYDSYEFYETYPYLEFDTLTDPGRYQVIAAFKQPADRLDEAFKTMLLAENEEDYTELMKYLKGCQFYDTGLQASYPDQLVTLTTCEYTQKDGRFFVVARKVDK